MENNLVDAVFWLIIVICLFGIGVSVGLLGVILELKKIGKSMATADQALQDLNGLFTRLATDQEANTAAIKSLIDDISSLHGLNPTAVEAIVAKGNAILQAMEASTKAAQDAVNPPAVVAVSVSPTSATLALGATQQFSATVQNATDSSVVWSVSPDGAGSVDQNGMFTAPATAGSATVTATSNADNTKSASASVSFA